ncbi:hypothetical protein F383_33449 [Gossypium arboreum]|uniref:Uncharacterized protein n=1 Tax=Gossypium arboreum TaxID=29729 RepID=A0A0B0N282_GOSAR|nr:hypothetical protein F383_33449 [Gossypium arboreum]
MKRLLQLIILLILRTMITELLLNNTCLPRVKLKLKFRGLETR